MFENWLSKLDKKIITSSIRKDKENIYNNIETYIKKIPNLKKIDVAIIGINKDLANDIRMSLYKLKYNFVNTNLIDLGNVKKNNPNFIIPLLRELLENNILPIIIGESNNIFYAMYQAYQSQSFQINAGIISNHLGKENSAEEFSIRDFINQEQNHLFTMSAIGIQGHYLSHKIVQTFNDNHFPICNLGAIKNNIVNTEPLMRDLDVLGFDISVVKSTHAPAANFSSPNGIDSHEACRLANYAGLSDKLTSFCLMGINHLKDVNNQTINLSSQIIWYFLEGYNSRLDDFPKSSKNLEKHKLNVQHSGLKYNFYRSKLSGRWWIELPWMDKKKFKRHYLIPCNPDEYESAQKGIEPQSITNARSRFKINLK